MLSVNFLSILNLVGSRNLSLTLIEYCSSFIKFLATHYPTTNDQCSCVCVVAAASFFFDILSWFCGTGR